MKCLGNDPLEVVYVDNHLLVAVKAPGIPTQTHRLGEESVEEQARAWVKSRFKKPGKVFLHAVHRLDKQVGGLVLFARTSKALSRLQQMMRERKIEKTYLALVEGVPKSKEKELEHYLVHGQYRSILSKPQEKGAKRAILHYKIIKQMKGRALLEVKLITGRYHQIRSQLSAIGHPIVGDKKYGSKQSSNSVGIALWHVELVFEHPVTKERLKMRAPWGEGVS